MGMGVDEAGDDGLARNVNGLCASRNGEVTHFANRFDPVIFDQDYGIIDDPAVLVRHGYNACAGEGDQASRMLRLHCHRQRNAIFWRGKFHRLGVFGQWTIGVKCIGLRGIHGWAHRPVQGIAIAAPMHIICAAIADLNHGKRAAR